MKFKVRIAGQEDEIEVTRQGDRLRVTRGGVTVALRLWRQDETHFLLARANGAGQRHLEVAGHSSGDQRHLWVNGRYLAYQRLRERHAPESTGPATAVSLSASIPSVVSQILVQEDDLVQAGDKLILLESMKMIMPVQAPYAGRVARIHCQTGDAVQPGVQLIEVEAGQE
jgi:acetyl-CoA carboxylase biotin carboxyl carrier protein